ncbi:MAG: hypothetical protein LBK71_02960 [Verrucomicrobiales bacterium]|nr:hypothetical protein [Verrucomicrobiales bacterium]
MTAKIPMFLSTIAAGEFAVGQTVTDLPLQSFLIQSYNMAHAVKAAEFYRSLKNNPADNLCSDRKIIINDLKILAQAEEDEIQTVLTEDKNTLWKMAEQLKKNSTSHHVNALLLSTGFQPAKLADSAQNELLLN